jgi:tetratricopeptide (TPR) repeat protein
VSADELLQALLGDDASLAPLTQLLIARTEGNPFFLEESVQTLVATGVLVGETGAYRLGQALPTIQVPATVQVVLAARIDRLSPEEKRLLQTAAVIGTEVPFALVQAIADMPEEDLHRGLAHLQAAEFLYETRLFPERAFTFKHALTHEVAYGGLLQERRRALHARIVEALETLAGDRVAEQVERLAHHALRGEVWAKALVYFRQAGEKAMARSAHREAGGYFEQALSVLPHLPETRDTREQAIDLRSALYQALYPLLEFGRSLEYLREAEPLAEALGDQRRLGWISAHMSYCLGMLGDMEHAIVVGQRAHAIAATLGDGALQCETNVHLGRTYFLLGDYRRAIEVLRRNVASIAGDQRRERVGMPDLPRAVMSRAFLALCHAERGEFAAGIARGEEAERMAEAVDQPLSRIVASTGVGILYLVKGDCPKAIPALERGLEVCQHWDIRAYAPGIASALGASYTLSRQMGEALPLLEQYAFKGAVGQPSRAVAWLSEAYLVAGRVEDAMQLAQQALELCQAHRNRGSEAWALRLRGAIAAQREPLEAAQAESSYQQALALAEELGMRPLQAHCHRGLGTLYAATGQREQARTALSTVIAMYRAMDMTFWLPQTEAALAQVEGC